MRLDHLLSKEHFYTTLHSGECGCVRDRLVPDRGTADAHGWNADNLSRVSVGPDGRLVGDISTHCWVLREQTFFPGKITIRSGLRLVPQGFFTLAGFEFDSGGCVV